MATEDIDIGYPEGSDPPSVIDDTMRADKANLQLYLDVDHMCELTGDLWPTEAAGAGKHRQITFFEVLGAAPDPADDEAMLYTLATGVGDDTEIYFRTFEQDSRQITAEGRLYIVRADMEDLVYGEGEDEDDPIPVLSFNGDDKMVVVLDDSTLEMDAVAGVQIKTPAVTDADGGAPMLVYDGTYDGDGGLAQVITVADGVTVRQVTIFKTTLDQAYATLLNGTAGHTARFSGAAGALVGDDKLKPSANGFTVGTASDALNKVGSTYRYIALCVRT